MSLPSSVTSAPAGSILMEARDLHKRYSIGRRTLEVLRGVSVQVARGEFLALRGASGAGKSTLLHLLGGLDTPNQGTILSDGVNLASLSNLALSRWRNQKVGFIFQAYHLLPELDALENVCLPARLGRISVDTAVERGRELLRRVGLADRMDHKPFELSGGEQQRVAIARSLINSPELLLADEPTGNLDSHTGEAIIELLCGLRDEHQTTLIVATHDAKVAGRAPRVLELADGIVCGSTTKN
jgi:lipoprotein-releasing system ATP-binding protein